jgi:hypothetical protein
MYSVRSEKGKVRSEFGGERRPEDDTRWRGSPDRVREGGRREKRERSKKEREEEETYVSSSFSPIMPNSLTCLSHVDCYDMTSEHMM